MKINIDTIMLDQDGVLANFIEGVHNVFGEPYDYSKLTKNWYFWEGWNKGVTGSEVNRRCTAEMWESLPWMHDGRELLDVILKKFDLEQVYILTVPMINPESTIGKTRWLQREIPKLSRRIITVGQDVSKGLLAKPNMLLIDDKDSNIDEFAAAGGQVVQVPRPWNRNSEFADCTVECVAGRLEVFRNGSRDTTKTSGVV